MNFRSPILTDMIFFVASWYPFSLVTFYMLVDLKGALDDHMRIVFSQVVHYNGDVSAVEVGEIESLVCATSIRSGQMVMVSTCYLMLFTWHMTHMTTSRIPTIMRIIIIMWISWICAMRWKHCYDGFLNSKSILVLQKNTCATPKHK